MEKNEIHVDTSEVRPDSNLLNHRLPERVPTAEAWPTQPKPLVLSSRDQRILTVYDLFLTLMPIGLLVKTGLVILAYKLDSNNSGSYFDQATALSRYLVSFNSQLVTLFTIVFVIIISTFVKRYALWKAQKGAYLSDLEQLQGSVSLPSTLKLIWSLRSFSVMSGLLVFVWAFYYLGSQAVKEEYLASNSETAKTHYSIIQRPDAINVFSPGINDLLNSSGSSNVSYSNIRDINYSFANALLTKGTNSQVTDDPTLGTNDGPLIPDFESVLESHTTDSTADTLLREVTGWIDVSKQSKNKDIFTTFQGVSPTIVFWTPKDKEDSSYYSQQLLGSYTVATSYISVGCSDLEILPLDSFPNGTSYNSSFSLNMTSYRADAPRDTAGHSLREFNYWYRTTLLVNGTITHAAGGGIEINGGTDVNYALKSTCNVTTKYIDLKVSCLTTGCYPHAMRWQNNTDGTNATSYSTPFDSEDFGNAFLSNLTLSTGAAYDWVNDWPLLYDYLTASSSGVYNTSDPSSWSGQAPTLALMQTFNTYLTISQSNLQQNSFSNIIAIMESGSDTSSSRLMVKGAPFIRAYRIYWQWIPIDFAASFILLAAAIASWWLRLNTLAPDIFGYVSSLTRDNEYVPLPTEGSTLSGIDRARMLKHVKVKIGDIHEGSSSSGERSVGRIGLAPVNADIEGLQRERLYA